MFKKYLLILIPIFFMFTTGVALSFENLNIGYLVLNNFIEANCHFFKTPKETKILELDSSFVNIRGSSLAPTSCKGGNICWSWSVKSGTFDWKLYDSNLPLQIKSVERATESIRQTIKLTSALRKDSSQLADAAAELLKSAFSTGKSATLSKEREISLGKVQEQAVESYLTPAFHKFLAMALQGPLIAIYPLCLASAVELLYYANEYDRGNDLVEAFVIFKTVSPQDIEFSPFHTFLNRAKFLYLILSDKIEADPNNINKAKFAWAQAVLFAKLLEWPEFEKVRVVVDKYISETFEIYDTLKTKTTGEIAKTEKLLAGLKYLQDQHKNYPLFYKNSNSSTDIIEDNYAFLAIVYQFINSNVYQFINSNSTRQNEKEFIASLKKAAIEAIDNATKNNDQLLNIMLIKPNKEQEKILALVLAAIPLVGGVVFGVLYWIAFLLFKKWKLRNFK